MTIQSKKTVIVTGGSGFIGTNLCVHLKQRGWRVFNVDIREPQIAELKQDFICADILDQKRVHQIINDLNPDSLVHLAARTDLKGDSISAYNVNIEGTQNICSSLEQSSRKIKSVFASSMLVNRVGIIPEDEFTFSPTTIYGRSKVISEYIIRSYNNPNFSIIRPTSIWGPWFQEPYANFFKSVLKGYFLKIKGISIVKSFGYVGNTVKQIEFAMEQNSDLGIKCYLGDTPSISVNDWADLIRKTADKEPNLTISADALQTLARFGDVINMVFPKFPITSFRYNNLITNNEYGSRHLIEIPQDQRIQLQEGVAETLKWLQQKV